MRQPFRKDSARAKLFSFLLKPRSLPQFQKRAESLGVNAARMLRLFRKGVPDGNVIWVLYENEGKVGFTTFHPGDIGRLWNE